MATEVFARPLYGAVGSGVEKMLTDVASPTAALKRKLERVAEAESMLMRGESFDVVAFYAECGAADIAFPIVARASVLRAINVCDTELFDRIRKDLSDYAVSWKHPDTARAIELVDSEIRLRLRLSQGYPQWLMEFDFAGLPKTWYLQTLFLGIRALLEQRRHETALVSSNLARAVNALHGDIDSVKIRLLIYAATACREMHRFDEMTGYLQMAMIASEKSGFFTPFLGFSLAESTSSDLPKKSLNPALAAFLHRHIDNYFLSTIRMRNHLTGGHVTEKLTRRQFFITRHISYGLSYKEVSEMLGLSIGRFRNIISEIYALLGVHSRSALATFVW